MAKFLHFNSEKAAKNLLQRMEKLADEATKRFYDEASVKKGAIMGQLEEQGYYIHDYVVFGASAIMESFGTGYKMDKTSRYLSDYMKSSLWNPNRYGYDVVGREQGEYTNIYGKDVVSSGAFAGINIEGLRYWSQYPTYTIQNAEKWLEQKNGWLDKMIEETITDWVKNDMPRFFEYG